MFGDCYGVERDRLRLLGPSLRQVQLRELDQPLGRQSRRGRFERRHQRLDRFRIAHRVDQVVARDTTAEPPDVEVGEHLVGPDRAAEPDGGVEVVDRAREIKVVAVTEADEAVHGDRRRRVRLFVHRLERRLVVARRLTPRGQRHRLVAGPPRVVGTQLGVRLVAGRDEVVRDRPDRNRLAVGLLREERVVDPAMNAASGELGGLVVRRVRVQRVREMQRRSVTAEDPLSRDLLQPRVQRGTVETGDARERRPGAVRDQEGHGVDDLARVGAECMQSSVDGGPHRVGDTRGPGRPRPTVDVSLPGELLHQEWVPVARDRNITRVTARLSAPQSRASSAASSSDSGPRCRVAHRGSRRRAETPSMARPCVSSRHVARSRSGTLSPSKRKSRWRSRSIVAGSAHCRSSTNTTLGVPRVNSNTSRVSPSSCRVRCWSSGSAGSRPASARSPSRLRRSVTSSSFPGTIGKSCPDLGEQGLAERQVRQLEPFVRPARHDPEPRAFGDVDELLRETGLPDAAPTLDDDHLGVTPRDTGRDASAASSARGGGRRARAAGRPTSWRYGRSLRPGTLVHDRTHRRSRSASSRP